MKNFLKKTSLAFGGSIPLSPGGSGFQGVGKLGTGSADEAPDLLSGAISTAVGFMTIVAIIWFVLQFFVGAIGIISAGGDASKIAESRQKILTAIIGVVVVIASIFLIDIVGTILGYDDIGILDVGTMINRLVSP